MYIIADLTDLYNDFSMYRMSLCSLGIMGTEYVRADPLATEVTLEQGSTTTLEIP